MTHNSNLPAAACSPSAKAATSKTAKSSKATATTSTPASNPATARRKISPRAALFSSHLRQEKPCRPKSNMICMCVLIYLRYLRDKADDYYKKDNEKNKPGKFLASAYILFGR